NLVDTFANKKIHFTLFESLPKEKTAILGETDLSMGSHFLKYPPRDPNNADQPPADPPLSFSEIVPIVYANPRLLVPPPTKTDTEDGARPSPEFVVELALSQPLIPAEVVENGNFLTFRVGDLYPVPDEWTLKEGNEKDLNSNMYTYSLSFPIPSESSFERMITIPNGMLVTTEPPADPDPSAPNPVLVLMPKPEARGSRAAAATSSDTPEGASGTAGTSPPADESAVGTAAAAPTPAEKVERSPLSETYKRISWAATHIVWMPPEAVVRFRERILSKVQTDVEFTRDLQPRFAHVIDTNAQKYRGRATVDFSCLLFPRVIGIKGRHALDGVEPPSSAPCEPTNAAANAAVATAGGTASTEREPVSRSKKGKDDGASQNLYRNLGTVVHMDLMLEKPLLDKKKLQPAPHTTKPRSYPFPLLLIQITKSVGFYIPRRVIPPTLLYEKRSQRADQEYRVQIQEIVRKLVKEYQSALVAETPATEFAPLVAVNSANAKEEQQRKKKFLFHLNTSGAYFSFKEELKASVIEVVRD
ncbi:hypothetical protein BDK51DRAFT_31766, partial [Blyttiomyces helicus]